MKRSLFIALALLAASLVWSQSIGDLQKQKKQEAEREDDSTSDKSSLENVLDAKDKTQKVFQVYSVS